MLGKAVVKRAGANPPPRTNNAELGKQLFPSSSPSSTATQNGNIKELWKRQSLSSKPWSRPSATTEPLQSRSANFSRSPPRAANGRLESLLTKTDCFQENPDMIDILDDGPPLSSTSRSNTAASSVFFAVDDFSDDDNLDLDFQAPSALPTLPPPRPQPQAQKRDDPTPATDTSTLSWSQSSPSHFVKPQPRLEPTSQRDLKRESPDDDRGIRPATKKTRRELPKHWEKKPEPQEQKVEEPYEASRTPAPKAKEPYPWDTTASAIKAQKKQLKIQQKEPEPARDAIKSVTKAAAITLSNEQRHVKSLVVDKGQSVFFTGPAGTGKSVLMRAIIAELKKKHARDPERVAVTASTGLAACNIGGMTLHSFSGIGLGKEDAPTLVKKIRRNPKAKNRWLKTKTLVIDEISMVDGGLFDKLSQIGRTIRNNGRPWGGIQLVITGDFFQLPPVPDGHNQRDVKFAFEAATWNVSIDHTIGLTEVFRQRDPEFAQMLNEMRLGRISDRTVQNFQALNRPLHFDDGLEVTELFPTRNEVDSSNQRRLQALTGKSHVFSAYDTGDPLIRDKLLANMMAPPNLELKKGAQVMLIKNVDETLVNGSLGTVVDFMTEAAFEITGGRADDGADSDVETDTKKRIRAFSKALADGKSDTKAYPYVRFQAVDGSQRCLLCVPEDWKVELPTGEVQASRKQIPLILAWALSIHKAQGQTLERVKVDLGKVFEKGQAYVALSRATTQQGLQVLRFQKDKVMAHPRVVGFYNKLYSVEKALRKETTNQSITKFTYDKRMTPSSGSGSARNSRDRSVIDLDNDDDEAEAAAAAAYG